MPTKPILAATVNDIHALTYPLIATPKIDGIRCWLRGGQALSRTLKLIPNRHVQLELKETGLDHLDGELITLTGDEPDPFNTVQSKIMSKNVVAQVRYLVFDEINPANDDVFYKSRLDVLNHVLRDAPSWVQQIPTRWITGPTELLNFETHCLVAGYEGVCMRSPHSPYKSGRSTLREQYLLKLKRFVDDEATVVGFVELLHNLNPPEATELGSLKRGKKKEFLEPGNKLGALIVGRPGLLDFEIGTGFTDAERVEIWQNRHSLVGKAVTYKHQPHGALERPRSPVFKGFRYD